jgi:hypothetical protein
VSSLAFPQKEGYIGVRLDTAEHELVRRWNAVRGRTVMRRLDHWRARQESVARDLAASALQAVPATLDQVEFLMRRPFTPGMVERGQAPSATRRRWRKEDLATFGNVRVEPGFRVSRVESQYGPAGWVGHVLLHGFPDDYGFPDLDPWGAYADKLEYPVEVNIRARIVPMPVAKDDLAKQVARVATQMEHVQQAGKTIPAELREKMEVANYAAAQIDADRMPLAYGHAWLVVDGATREEVIEKIDTLVQHYARIGIDAEAFSGAQAALLRASVPGEPVRLNVHQQRWSLAAVAEAMPFGTSTLGDGRGMYRGYTTGRARNPVQFDPHDAPMRLNRAGGVLLLGAPGGGKSAFGAAVTVGAVAAGAYGLVVDPSGRLDVLSKHPVVGPLTEVYDLADAEDGALDPFSVTPRVPVTGDPVRDDKNEKLRLQMGREAAFETARLLLPPSSIDDDPDRRTELALAIDEVSRDVVPSFARVVEVLRRPKAHVKARSVGAELALALDMPHARLFSKPLTSTTRAAERIESRLTIMSLRGLQPRKPWNPRKDATSVQRAADALMHLLGYKARHLLHTMPPDVRKIAMFDEARIYTGTSGGRQLLQDMGLDGRKQNLAFIVCAHMVSHVEELKTAFPFIAAFRQELPEEQVLTTEMLGIDPSYASMLGQLLPGESVTRDLAGQVDLWQHHLWDATLVDLLNTTPTGVAVAA